MIVSPDRSPANVIDNVVSTARAAHEAGVRQVWLPQNFNYDAVALAALVGLAVPGLPSGAAGPATLRSNGTTFSSDRAQSIARR
jgi:hypothetical protein